MQLLQNIKLNYYAKIIENQLNENKSDELLETLIKLANINFDIFNKLSHNAIHSILSKYETGNLLNSKLFWINSFNLNDAIYVEQFVKYYLSKQSYDSNYDIENYHDIILDLLNHNNFINGNFELNDHVKRSYIIQFFKLAIEDDKLRRKIILNNSAFFQSGNEQALTHPRLTSGYVLIVKNPYQIYQIMKKNFTSPSIELLNSDDHPIEYKTKEQSLYIYRKGWHIFNQSWSDSNIKDTLNGLIIKYEDLVDNPGEELSRLVFHLKQTGFDIQVNYDLIENYIEQNQILPEEEPKNEFSKNELKSLSDLSSIANKFQYTPY